MSLTDNQKAIGSKLLYHAGKHQTDLQELPIEQHGALVQMLANLFDARVNEFKQQQIEMQLKAQAEIKEANEAAERERKFGVGGPVGVGALRPPQ